MAAPCGTDFLYPGSGDWIAASRIHHCLVSVFPCCRFLLSFHRRRITQSPLPSAASMICKISAACAIALTIIVGGRSYGQLTRRYSTDSPEPRVSGEYGGLRARSVLMMRSMSSLRASSQSLPKMRLKSTSAPKGHS